MKREFSTPVLELSVSWEFAQDGKLDEERFVVSGTGYGEQPTQWISEAVRIILKDGYLPWKEEYRDIVRGRLHDAIPLVWSDQIQLIRFKNLLSFPEGVQSQSERVEFLLRLSLLLADLFGTVPGFHMPRQSERGSDSL